VEELSFPFFKTRTPAPHQRLMSKRKRKSQKRKTTDVTAEALIATGAQAIVVSAGADESMLKNLIRLCNTLQM
jgi:fructose-1-phosphate kinase PfkB-like protein